MFLSISVTNIGHQPCTVLQTGCDGEQDETVGELLRRPGWQSQDDQHKVGYFGQ